MSREKKLGHSRGRAITVFGTPSISAHPPRTTSNGHGPPSAPQVRTPTGKSAYEKLSPAGKATVALPLRGFFFLWQVTVTNPHPRILQITQPKLGRNLRGKINARRIGYRSAKLVFPAIVSSEISRFSLRFTQCQIRKLSSGIGVVRCIPIIVVFIPRAYFPNQHIKNSFIRRFVINIRRIRRVLVIRFNGIGNVAPPPEISKLHIFVGQCNLIFSISVILCRIDQLTIVRSHYSYFFLYFLSLFRQPI